ncbi:putative protein phosphatase 2C 60 [Canna indica]|uniref:protein-serine/threonine phosphatase n=1 Tax=Canna indica TaxID=4628 RepID=A0AAQ3KMB1_9LILI|nr:putative protein phosphatase 2C 60 [Canna indica]
MKPMIATVGSCCLLGTICSRTLYVANLGDSRIVLGRLVKETGEVLAVQLSTEHNAGLESIRHELYSLHPNDSKIVLKHDVWRVKGLIQKPILNSEPSIAVKPLQREDQFLIFASDGLWEQLGNQEAVNIVQNHPSSGSAQRLVEAALQQAANKREIRYSDLNKIDRGIRRHFHDDITVIVIFLDLNLISRASSIRSPKL